MRHNESGILAPSGRGSSKQPRISVYVPKERHDDLKAALGSKGSNFTKWVNEMADVEIASWKSKMKEELAPATGLH